MEHIRSKKINACLCKIDKLRTLLVTIMLNGCYLEYLPKTKSPLAIRLLFTMTVL